MKRQRVLLKLIKQHGWRKGAEIGVNRGGLYFYLLDGCPELSMIAVDLWPENEPFYGDLRETGAAVKKRAETYGDRAIVLHGHSVDMAREVQDGSLDFVFIDADHSKRAVLADIAAWEPKVKVGGSILGHDIDWPSVAEAVTEIFGPIYGVLPDDVWGVDKLRYERRL